MFWATVSIALLLMLAVFAVLVFARTPRYRLEAADLIRLLRDVLAAKASANAWNLGTSVPFRHDSRLEAARQRCLDIEQRYWLGGDKLFSRDGVVELRQLLSELEQHYPQAAQSAGQTF